MRNQERNQPRPATFRSFTEFAQSERARAIGHPSEVNSRREPQRTDPTVTSNAAYMDRYFLNDRTNGR